MSMKARLLLLALPLVSGRALSAQGGSCIDQIRVPVVGQWAEYKAVFKQQEPYTMRYAVIGEESRGGKDFKGLGAPLSCKKKGGRKGTTKLGARGAWGV